MAMFPECASLLTGYACCQCPLGCAALRKGDFRERGLFVDQGLHFLDERPQAEVDLALQLAPHTGRSRALVNEGDIVLDGTSALCRELCQPA